MQGLEYIDFPWSKWGAKPNAITVELEYLE